VHALWCGASSQGNSVVLSTGEDFYGFNKVLQPEHLTRLTNSARSLFPHITEAHLKTVTPLFLSVFFSLVSQP
jgi:hypothetical protein